MRAKLLKPFLVLAALSLTAPFLLGLLNYQEFADKLDINTPYSSVDPVLEVGTAAPAFSLTDQSGATYSLAQFKGKKNVLLIFYRGSWCPFCVSHLEDIQNLFPTLEQYNVQLLAISKDADKKSAKLAKRFKAPYVFLSDPKLETTASYRIRNDKDLPHPAIFLIDKSGNIVWYHIDQNYKRRASGSQLKAILESLPEDS